MNYSSQLNVAIISRKPKDTLWSILEVCILINSLCAYILRVSTGRQRENILQAHYREEAYNLSLTYSDWYADEESNSNGLIYDCLRLEYSNEVAQKVSHDFESIADSFLDICETNYSENDDSLLAEISKELQNYILNVIVQNNS